MERNYLQLEDFVEIKPIMREVTNAIRKKIDDKMFKDNNIANIEIRKFILATLIESLATWNKTGDCLPIGIPLNDDKVINVVIVKKEGM